MYFKRSFWVEGSPRRVAKSPALLFDPAPVAERAPAAPRRGLTGQIRARWLLPGPSFFRPARTLLLGAMLPSRGPRYNDRLVARCWEGFFFFFNNSRQHVKAAF